MKILFTGEQGNLVRAIKEAIIREGKHKWVTPHDYWLSIVSGHHQWPEFDINHWDFPRRVAELKPDIVVHCAAVVGTDKCQVSAAKTIDTNVLGTHNVLRACDMAGAGLVYLSTTATYDVKAKRPYTEESPQKPETLYGITKYAGELLVRSQVETHVPWCVIRPCFIYGVAPYDHSSMLTKVAVHEVLKRDWPWKAGRKLKILLDPMGYKDYMHVDDFADAIAGLLSIPFRALEGHTFNVSQGLSQKVVTYFSELERILGIRAIDAEWISDADYLGDHTVSSQKLRACTGWAPRIGLHEGLTRLVKSAEAYVQECKFAGKEPLYL